MERTAPNRHTAAPVTGHAEAVLLFAPRISHRLLDALVRLDDPSVPIAETHRRLADHAVRMGLPRPSYERIRELVHEYRGLRRRGPTTSSVLLDVALRTRPPDTFLDHISGVGVPNRP